MKRGNPLEKTIDKFYADTYHKFFSHFKTYDERLIRVLQSLINFMPQSILDLACGAGLSTLALKANFGNSEIVGVDIDSNMITLAREKMPNSQVQFHCCEISDILARTPNGTVDLIFVKSAYHYFEHKIPLSYLQPLLKKNGVIVVAERTVRSASSYPLPKIASSYWASIFAEPRPSDRLDAAKLLGMPLSVSCYGEQVTIPTDIYFDAVKKNQLVGLWMLKPETIFAWIENRLSQETDGFHVFEEFWLYVYHNI
ncbi:trans-aconitate 2-methyltransferase [Okeania sp. SIO2F5]|uniref:class I SAM-dependent methyltransferase n=1 Tax=Okeania sp. SIO2F5 TaxID=2607794 RepID=UPI00257C0904|nr:class I SAM-dependent methyltransferase [Okeania sp. SIO2F5]